MNFGTLVPNIAPMSGVPITITNAATTGTEVILAPPHSFIHHKFIITGAAGVTGGVIQLEESTSPTDTNLWDPITTPITVIAGDDLSFNATGIFNQIRARISTPITGGVAPSVTVVYVGGKNY
jgi:hypothetical protein